MEDWWKSTVQEEGNWNALLRTLSSSCEWKIIKDDIKPHGGTFTKFRANQTFYVVTHVDSMVQAIPTHCNVSLF